MRRINLLLAVCLLGCVIVTSSVAQTSVSLDVPFFSQKDAQWKDNSLGGGNLTIGSHGCTMTSVAMVLAYYNFALTPATFNDWLTIPENNGYDSGYYLYWSKIAEYSKNTVINPDEKEEEFRDKIRGEIDSKRPVIAKTIDPLHWVVIVGYNIDNQGNISYSVNDPLKSSGHTILDRELGDVYRPVSASVSSREFVNQHVAIGQMPDGSINQHFVNMGDEIITAYGLDASDVVAYNNSYDENGELVPGADKVHQFSHFGIEYTVQDVEVKNAGMTHERTLFVLGHDGHTERVMWLKEGFYWLFLMHNTGTPTGNETWSGDGTNIYQIFSETIARWYPNEGAGVLRLISRSTSEVIAEYQNPTYSFAGDISDGKVLGETGGSDTETTSEPDPTPAPEPQIVIEDVSVELSPALEGGTNVYEIEPGKQTISINFIAMPPSNGLYKFYVDGSIVEETWFHQHLHELGPGTHTVYATSSYEDQFKEAEPITIMVEEPLRSDFIPVGWRVNGMLDTSWRRLLVYGAKDDGGGFILDMNMDNPDDYVIYEYPYRINHMRQVEYYVFVAEQRGLFISNDQARTWPTKLYSDGTEAAGVVNAHPRYNNEPHLVAWSTGVNSYKANWTLREWNKLKSIQGGTHLGRVFHMFCPDNWYGKIIYGTKHDGLVARNTSKWYRLEKYTIGFPVICVKEYVGGTPNVLVAFDTKGRTAPEKGQVQLSTKFALYPNSYHNASQGLPEGDDVVVFFYMPGQSYAMGAITRSGQAYSVGYTETTWNFRQSSWFNLNLPWTRQEHLEPSIKPEMGQEATCAYARDGNNVKYIAIGLTKGLKVVRIPIAKLITDQEEQALPQSPALEQNFPNPFNASTQIDFYLPQNMHTEISVYNILGVKVGVLASKTLLAGNHTVKWEGDGHASGAYLYKMRAGNEFYKTKKMLLAK